MVWLPIKVSLQRQGRVVGIKFVPKTIEDFVDNKDNLEKIIQCINKCEPVIVVSPPGTGKTTSAYLVANFLGYTVKEYNASDERKKSDLQEIKRVVSTKPFSKILVLLDECDGIENQNELSSIIKKSKVPIIATANDKYKIRELSKVCTLIEFDTPSLQSIAKHIRNLDPNANIKLDTDIRSSLNRTFNGGEKYERKDSDFDKVVDIFRNQKKVDIDPVWLMDNVSEFFFGSNVIEAIETIKIYERTKNPNVLIFPDSFSGKPKYPNYWRCLKNGHNR